MGSVNSVLYMYFTLTVVLIFSSTSVSAAETVQVYAPATTVPEDGKPNNKGKPDSTGVINGKGTDDGEVYYVIDGYKINAPVYKPDGKPLISKSNIPPKSAIIQVLFPLEDKKDVKDINGFYGYILAVKPEERSEYSFVPDGEFTYTEFQSRCKTGGRIIILPIPLDKRCQDAVNAKKVVTGEPTKAIISVFALGGELSDDLSIREVYYSSEGDKNIAEIRLNNPYDERPLLDGNNTYFISGGSLFVYKAKLLKVRIREIRKAPELLRKVNTYISVELCSDCDGLLLLDENEGEKKGFIAVVKVSENDNNYLPGYVVAEIEPIDGEITHVDNTELYSTVYFTSNWLPDYFRALAKAKNLEVKVELDGDGVNTISGIKVGKEESLSKGSVAITRPVEEGEMVTVTVKKIHKDDSDGEREEVLIEITGEPQTIFGPAFKDERALSAKISAENDESGSYVRVKTDYKDYWFFGGWSRLRAKGILDISNSPSVKDDSLNASGDYLFRRLPVASEGKALEIGGGGGLEMWFYPEKRPALGGDSFWADVEAIGSITWYCGNLKEQKNLVRAEATPEFHYKLKRPDVSAIEGDLLRKFIFIPGSIFYNFDGIQLGLDVAGTYIFDEKTAVKEAAGGWFTYWAFVLKLDPGYVSSGFPIQFDSQSPVALNIGFAEGRRPPLMEEVDSRMFFDLEFAPNIGTKK